MGWMKLSFSTYFFLISFLLLLFFHTRGVIVHDEGYVLNSAEKVLAGQTIYKDFHFSYTPGSVYAVAVSFIIFGHSVFSSRIIMIFGSFMSTLLIFSITKKITKRDIYGYINSTIFIAWGPSHINFAWPVMFVIPTTLGILYLLLKFNESRNNLIPFTVGILCVLDFLFKQNFGIIFIPVLFAFFTTRNYKFTTILYYFYGLAWGFIFFIIYLLLTNSFSPFLSDFYEFTIKKILLHNEITTPLIYRDTFVKSVARSALYFSPAYLSIIAIILFIKRNRYHLIFLPLAVLLFLVIGIRPTTDYVHVVPILSLVGIPLVIIINQFPTTIVKIIGYLIIIIIIFLGFYSALFKGYYRWDNALIENNKFMSGRLNVSIHQQLFFEIEKMKAVTNLYTENKDYIFVDTYAPLLYFALDRRQPSAYDFPGFTQSNLYQNAVVYSLVTKNVNLIFLLSEHQKSKITEYTHKYYKKIAYVHPYYVYLKLDNIVSER